jgi:Flp pilus assembly protein TadG
MSEISRAITQRSRRDPESGAAAVEFALIVPVLLLVVFGIINFAGLFSTQLALNNGVRQAARQAVVPGSSTAQECGNLVGAVQEASSPPLGANKATIEVRTARVATGNPTGATTATPCGNNYNSSATAMTSAQRTTRACAGSAANSTGAVESLRVEARIPAKLLVPMPIPGFAGTFTLSSKAVYRCEFSS